MIRLRVRYEELKLFGNLIVDDVKADSKAIALEIIAEAGKYPPVPATSRYHRTGELFRGWTIGRPYQRSDVIGVQIDNNMWYAGLVVGDEQMALHAAHGWRRIQDVASKYEQSYANKIYASITHRWGFS